MLETGGGVELLELEQAAAREATRTAAIRRRNAEEMRVGVRMAPGIGHRTGRRKP